MVDAVLLVGGVLMICAIVPLASTIARRTARARPPAPTPSEQQPETRPDLEADLADVVAHVAGYRFRVIDRAGSELGISTHGIPSMGVGDTVHLSDGRGVTVLEVYADQNGHESGVRATLVVDDS